MKAAFWVLLAATLGTWVGMELHPALGVAVWATTLTYYAAYGPGATAQPTRTAEPTQHA